MKPGEISTGQVNYTRRTLITYRPHKLKELAKALVVPPEVEEFLRSCYKRDPRYPPIAVFKLLLLFFMSTFHHLTAFYEWACEDTDFLRAVGFNLNYYGMPSYKTIWHFMMVRIGVEKIHELFYVTLKVVKNKVESSLDVCVGRSAIMDATPIEATSRDKEASYNGHYKMRCYLWSRLLCADTGLPLGFEVTTGSVHEGHIGLAIVYRAILNGITIDDLWIDNKYAFSEAIASYWLFGIRTHYRVSASWNFSRGTMWQKIFRDYQRMWRGEDFKAYANYDEVLRYVAIHKSLRIVGQHLRSLAVDEWLEAPDTYREGITVRSIIEVDNGYAKRMSGLKGREFRGRAHILLQVGFYEASRLILAYSRIG